jgi:hypothetical protein
MGVIYLSRDSVTALRDHLTAELNEMADALDERNDL